VPADHWLMLVVLVLFVVGEAQQ